MKKLKKLVIIIIVTFINLAVTAQEKPWSIYGIANGLPHDLINSIVTAQNGNVFVSLSKVGSQQGGIGVFDGKSWQLINTSTENFKENDVTYIAVNNRKIIVHYRNQGYSIFDGNKWENLDLTGLDSTINLLEPIIFDNDGNIWAGLHNQRFLRTGKGVGFYDSIWHVLKIDSNYYNDSRQDIFDVKMDNTGNIWVSSWNALFKRNINGDWEEIDSLKGFTPEHPFKIECDSKNNIRIWANRVQYNSSYLCKFDGNSWSYFNSEDIDILQNRTTALQVDKNDNVWIGTEDSGVFRYDGVNCTRYFLKEWNYFVYGGGEPNSITFDSSGRVWILIGSGHGIYVLNPSLVDCEESLSEQTKTSEEIPILFPNPAIDKLFLNTYLKNKFVRIYSIYGNTVLEAKYSDFLDISKLLPGVYLLEIAGQYQKFIKI